MAIAKTVFKKTYTEAIVKVAGPSGNATINLATDLLATNEALVPAGTPTVNIAGVTWTGTADGVITISRNGITVMTLNAAASGFLDFGGQMFQPDKTENTSNILVTIAGTQAECWIRLRKTAGYKNTDYLTAASS
jgi:hypothetical protein